MLNLWNDLKDRKEDEKEHLLKGGEEKKSKQADKLANAMKGPTKRARGKKKFAIEEKKSVENRFHSEEEEKDRSAEGRKGGGTRRPVRVKRAIRRLKSGKRHDRKKVLRS